MISVIVVLIAITIPSLSAARSAGKRLKSLSNLRSLGQTLTLYHDAYLAYPYAKFGFARPESDRPIAIGFPIWQIDRFWPLTMHEIAPWDSHAESWFSPGADLELVNGLINGRIEASTGIAPSYRLSRSFVGDPRLWTPRPADAQERATRAHQVATPSTKAMMFDHDRLYLSSSTHANAPRPILFADGRAAAIADQDATEPVVNLLDPDSPQRFHDTPNGILGSDL